MAKKERFIEREIDRTPYSGCVWVGLVVALIFILGTTSLWKTARYLKHHHILQISLPSFSGSSDENLIDKVKNVSLPSTPDLQKAQDDATERAKEALRQEAEKQIKEQADQAREQISQ